MSKGDKGGDGGLVVLAVLLGIAFFGPQLALQLAFSTRQMIDILAPLAGQVLLVVLVVILIRMYWSRW